MTTQDHHPLMMCGHAANGQCSAKDGKTFDPPIPSCVICGCTDIDPSPPTLAGRMAECAYRCGAKEPSSFALPFFEFKGDGSRYATTTCQCKKLLQLHWPRWQVKLHIVRRWFKKERCEDYLYREFNAPDEYANQKAEVEADFFRSQKHKETEVFSTTVAELIKLRAHDACGDFKPIGAALYDEYYCGCKGWD